MTIIDVITYRNFSVHATKAPTHKSPRTKRVAKKKATTTCIGAAKRVLIINTHFAIAVACRMRYCDDNDDVDDDENALTMMICFVWLWDGWGWGKDNQSS